jgi:hypothetical protein
MDEWSQHCESLRQLFQENVYGMWPGSPEVVTSTRVSMQADVGAGVSLIELELTEPLGRLRPLRLLLAAPSQAGAPRPCLLGLNFSGNRFVLVGESTHGRVPWPVSEVIERGYLLASIHASEIVADNAARAEEDLARLRCEPRSPRQRADTATIMAWAFGLSCAISALRREDCVAGDRIAVFGHSRLGKAALLAGAMDTRIAAVISSQSGCGGAAPWRVPPSFREPRADGRPSVETLESIVGEFPHWFAHALSEYLGRADQLPVEQSDLMALCAPRPLLLTNAADDIWAFPTGQYRALLAAQDAYRLFDPELPNLPVEMPTGDETVGGRLGWFIRQGGHSVCWRDWETWLSFADRWL